MKARVALALLLLFAALIGTAAVRNAVEKQFTALVREILRREKEKTS